MESHFLVIDLEATCDRTGWPHAVSEIIEIGAVLVEPARFEIVDELQTFVRPVGRPVLTPFCTELTSITQADVDGAPTFPEAISALARWLDRRPILFCSWGEYDRNQLRRDATRHRISLPLGREHRNLKQAFADRQGTGRLGMAQALRHVGLPLVGTHHRGIDDARNIARLLPYTL